MRANDTRRKATKHIACPMPTTKQVAFNPLTRRFEEVYPESEMAGEQIITMYWCRSAECYVTIPGRDDA